MAEMTREDIEDCRSRLKGTWLHSRIAPDALDSLCDLALRGLEATINDGPQAGQSVTTAPSHEGHAAGSAVPSPMSPSAEVAEIVLFLKSMVELPYGKELQQAAALLERLGGQLNDTQKSIADPDTYRRMIALVGDQQEKELERLQRENAELRDARQIEYSCAYCGQIVDGLAFLTAHVEACAKHPMRAAEAEGFERGVREAVKVCDDIYRQPGKNAHDIMFLQGWEFAAELCENGILALLPATQEPGAKEGG